MNEGNKMGISQFNVQPAEGGAADVALDLYLRSLEKGPLSRFVYGYGKGGKKNASHRDYPHVIKHTPRLTSMVNITLFRFANRDMFDDLNELCREVTRTSGPLTLHFHVLHSYQLNLEEVMTFCQKVKAHKSNITLVWTLHGHRNVIGRCAFTDGCEGWKTDYQKCPTFSNYPPVKIDKAHQQLPDERQASRTMLALGCQFILPNQHVAGTFNSLCGVGRYRIVNNGIDAATGVILAELPTAPAENGRSETAVVAHDLHYDGKISQQLMRAINALGDKIELHTFGKFSPFVGDNIINHGFKSDKRTSMSALDQIDGLMSSSRVDNYPLILCEAFSIGVPVIAMHSDVAQEVLARLGGKTFSEADVLRLMQLKKSDIAQAIFDTSLTVLGQCSRVVHDGQQMLEGHTSLYQNPQLSSATAALSVG